MLVLVGGGALALTLPDANSLTQERRHPTNGVCIGIVSHRSDGLLYEVAPGLVGIELGARAGVLLDEPAPGRPADSSAGPDCES